MPVNGSTRIMKTIKTQNQNIGSKKKVARICLWNRAMLDGGFSIGQPIEITQTGSVIEIRPNKDGKRKVAGVMNHGNKLPVIDLNQTGNLDLSKVGKIGEQVTVEFCQGLIRISLAKAACAALLIQLAA